MSNTIVINNTAVNNNTIINPVDATRPLVERETYGFVNTRNILDTFEKHGWTQVSSQFGKVRKIDRDGFQKHIVRLENPAFPSIDGLSDSNKSRPQLVLLNSHDGTSSLQIMWGLIRIACLNGIIAGTGLNGLRLVHSRSIVDKLPQGIDYMISNLPVFADQIKTLQSKTLSESATTQLIKTVYDARLSNIGDIKEIDYSMPLPTRIEDTENDAYTVFNRLQERLMRGGIEYTYNRKITDTQGNVVGTKEVDTRTRRLASVTTQVKLNQLCYDTALQLAA